jgi:hypothetical protein
MVAALCCFVLARRLFFADATAGDSAGDIQDVDLCLSIFPKRVSPSILG